MTESQILKSKTEAIRITSAGGPEVMRLEEVEIEPPSAGQVRVAIKAVGVNYIDIYQRSGRYVVEPPFTPGLEASGVVEALGAGVESVSIGDRVAFVGHQGCYAKDANVDASILIPLPDFIDFEMGAAFPLMGMTTQYLLTEYVKVRPDMVVLVHAAAGGMGTLLTQWASHLGARVIGTVSTDEKAEYALANGCSSVINYSLKHFPAEIDRLTGNSKCELIIDGVGKATMTGNLDAVCRRGTIVIFGSASGPAEPISPNEFQKKSLRVCGGSLFDYLLSEEEIRTRADDVLHGIKAGWLKLKINHRFKLAEAKDAHELLAARNSTGKIILTD